MIATPTPAFLAPESKSVAAPADRAEMIASRGRALAALSNGFPGPLQDVEGAAEHVTRLTQQLTAARVAHQQALNRLYQVRAEHERIRDAAERQLRGSLPPEFAEVTKWLDAEHNRLREYSQGYRQYSERREAYTSEIRSAIAAGRAELERSILTCATLADFVPIFEAIVLAVQLAWEQQV